MKRMEIWLAGLDSAHMALWIAVLAAAIEIVTAAFRFGLGLQSTRHTSFVGYLTFGLRIHHGYIGLLLLLIAWLRPVPIHWRHLAIILGGGLVLSDLVHHFLVLWPLTGSPQFDLVYPPQESREIPG